MERSDFWTHIGIVTIAFVVAVLPGLACQGLTVNSAIYLGGGTTVMVLALWGRILGSRGSSKLNT